MDGRLAVAAGLLSCAGCLNWSLGPAPDAGSDRSVPDAPADAFDCAAAYTAMKKALDGALGCDSSGTSTPQCMEPIGVDECGCGVWANPPQGDEVKTWTARVTEYKQHCSTMCAGMPCAAAYPCTMNRCVPK